ncbi:unnamed protein product [Cuscuta epithymum]|uniref:Uncharacterized protein n=1 Tax=Cuscuta epithymum TaxID=186058 RepID=A0AAV0FY93_9ASTE|nr:unnamed protein product [Cuscuta epithymum]
MQVMFEKLIEEDLCKFIVCLWSIWKHQNNKVWKNADFCIRNVIVVGPAALGGWREAQLQRQITGNANHEGAKWGKLGVGWIKVNVDAAINQQTGVRAWVWIAQDGNEQFIHVQRGRGKYVKQCYGQRRKVGHVRLLKHMLC